MIVKGFGELLQIHFPKNKLTRFNCLNHQFYSPPIHVEVHISEGTLHQLILVWGRYFLLIGQEEDVVGDSLVLLHTDEAVVVPVHQVEDLLRVFLRRLAGQSQDDQHELPEVDLSAPLRVKHLEDVAGQSLYV